MYQSNAAFGGHVLYTGDQFDAETGLYYSRARYLDPVAGRWTTQDPMSFSAGDTNLYRDVANSPTNATDPSGEAIDWVLVFVVIVVVVILIVGAFIVWKIVKFVNALPAQIQAAAPPWVRFLGMFA